MKAALGAETTVPFASVVAAFEGTASGRSLVAGLLSGTGPRYPARFCQVHVLVLVLVCGRGGGGASETPELCFGVVEWCVGPGTAAALRARVNLFVFVWCKLCYLQPGATGSHCRAVGLRQWRCVSCRNRRVAEYSKCPRLVAFRT